MIVASELTPERLVRLLTSMRLPLTVKRATQDAIAAVIEENGIAFERELRLGAHGQARGIMDPLNGVERVHSDESRLRMLAERNPARPELAERAA